MPGREGRPGGDQSLNDGGVMFIIIYADNDQLTCPLQWDADCEGAVHCWMGGKEPVAVFKDRKAARKAIEISVAWNRLKAAQDENANDDFTNPALRKHLRIVPLIELAK